MFLLGVLLRDSSLGISMAPLGRRLVLLVFAVVMTTPVFGKVIIHFYSRPPPLFDCKLFDGDPKNPKIPLKRMYSSGIPSAVQKIKLCGRRGWFDCYHYCLTLFALELFNEIILWRISFLLGCPPSCFFWGVVSFRLPFCSLRPVPMATSGWAWIFHPHRSNKSNRLWESRETTYGRSSSENWFHFYFVVNYTQDLVPVVDTYLPTSLKVG